MSWAGGYIEAEKEVNRAAMAREKRRGGKDLIVTIGREMQSEEKGHSLQPHQKVKWYNAWGAKDHSLRTSISYQRNGAMATGR